MASLPDGDYFIVNGYAPTLYMGVESDSRANGADVKVFARTNRDGQIFQVTTRRDGSRQICNRFTGKSIDVSDGNFRNGQNVQIYTDNDTRAQRWEIAETSGTITVDGTSYPLWQIRQADTQDWCVELYGNSGFQPGDNVCISQGSAADQKWAFVPVPLFEDGGVYELVLRLDTRYCLDMAYYSKANGGNCILAGRHGGNNQKWVLTEASEGKWTIRNVNSGKNLEVQNGVAKDMQNVQQWQSTSTQREWWNPVAFGTTTLNGRTCQMVKLYSWVDGGGNTYVMDSNQNAQLDLGNICIVHTDPDPQGQYSQTFILYPTRAQDPTMPVPFNLGMATSVGAARSANPTARALMYPTWQCSGAWATPGANHYNWRYRSRYMDSDTTAWGAWGDYTPWETALVTQRGNQAWVTQGLTCDYDLAERKNLQYEIQVMAVGSGDTENVYGGTATEVITIPKSPTIILSGAGWGADGLHLQWQSDYEGGQSRVNISKVYFGTEQVFSGKSSHPLDYEDSCVVGADLLSRWPEDGEQVRVVYTAGNDQLLDFGVEQEQTASAAYDAGHDATAEPTIARGDGYTLTATVPHIGTERMWVNVNGKLTELDGEVDGGTTTFRIVYPFGVDFDVMTVVTNDGMTRWATDMTAISKSDPRVEQATAHVWTWGTSGSATLRTDRFEMGSDYSLTAVYEADVLNDRAREAVHFVGTLKGEFTATGSVADVFRDVTQQTFERLIEQGRHVLYRSPRGDMADVAIVGVRFVGHPGYFDVQVTMVEETV